MAEICSVCGLPKELCMCEEIAREQQTVRISVDSRRYGKMVTVIDGIDENDIDIADLAKQLKNKCAAGGTYKDGRIELQGDHKKRVKAVLEEMGFRTEVR
ncbi:MAG: stress response translation initiation inhibitor YciH [Candidatus Methanomethylophilaceae archaeon]|nr:stress response translation initiation inhibitor YciH [Thermoplasmata archaeon]MBO7352549.1 stress response translation initiation inhibitor YciH [Candidatus Methanomethylophilaceae archaeon]MBP5685601.1 stress response translation initiation inhibitor YciH [Candidatus Methanomethylophilaceae archaeon]MBP5735116.1 stress response translation initiation inhibitor YciH [Candidatus Methanomethylophilaceae archaeon]MBR6213148.1 stress response translation initiation inhibitor YciH [Candidatus Me